MINRRIHSKALALFVLLAASCSLQNREKKETTSSAAGISARNKETIDRIVLGDPPPNASVRISVTGSSNNVTVQFPGRSGSMHKEDLHITNQENQNETSQESFSYQFIARWPLWITMIGSGFAILLLAFGWSYAKKQVPALAIAEAGITRQIAKWEEKAMKASDPKDQAEAAIELARLNKERGQLYQKPRK